MKVIRMPDNPRVTVAIATTGRCTIVGRTIAILAAQKDPPDRVILSIAQPGDADLAGLPPLPFPIKIVSGPKGSCVQRNAVLRAPQPGGIILFLDDDFLIADGYISALRRLFTRHADVVMATGRVLADGIHGPGYTHEQGLAILAQAPQTAPDPQIQEVYSVYGCNMAIRAAPPELFDEALPLYGWLEDMDLSQRMARYGRIVRDDSLVGVHLGTKQGRSAGLLLGYSQITNPVHMIRKGFVSRAPVLKIMIKNILSNLARSLRPEPWIDRRGRLRGNVTALRDLLRGRCTPNRVLELRTTPASVRGNVS